MSTGQRQDDTPPEQSTSAEPIITNTAGEPPLPASPPPPQSIPRPEPASPAGRRESTSQSENKAARSGRTARILAWGAAILLPLAVAVGVAFAWTEFTDQLAMLGRQQTAAEQQLIALSQRLSEMEGRFAPLGQRDDEIVGELTQLKQAALPGQQLNDRMTELQGRIARVDQTVQQMAPGMLKAGEVLDRVNRLEALALRAATLDQRIDALEKGIGPTRDALVRAAATVLAIGQVGEAVRGSGGFQKELLTLKVVAGNDADLQEAVTAMEPYAQSGVPTLPQIIEAFPALAVSVMRAEPGDGDESRFERVLHRLSGLVVIRRTGAEAVADGGVQGLLAEAEQALAAGDLRAAVEFVAKIDGPGGAATSDWLAAARARLAVDQAVMHLQNRAISRLSEIKG